MAKSKVSRALPEAERRPAVILVQPQEEGNVGSVARAMANMGLRRLILVEPAPVLAGVAQGFGVGGWEILEHCERYDSFEAATAGFQRLVGTASRRARSLHRTPPIEPRDLGGRLALDPPQTRTALVFGCESNGLSRQDLERCHPVVSIPCDAGQPTLNLAQAVLVVAYELLMARRRDESVTDNVCEVATPSSKTAPATLHEVRSVLDGTSQILRQIGYDQDHIHHGLMRDVQLLASRVGMTQREARLLRRVLNRARGALGRGAARSDESST